MIGYRCNKCKCESPSPVCRQCGRKLSMGTMRDMWSVYNTPLKDADIWKRTVCVAGGICAALLVVMFIAETAANGFDASLVMLVNGGITWVLITFLATLLTVLVFLALQKTETLVFVLDTQGAHMQTWHEPKRLQCYARLQSADLDKAVLQADGNSLLNAQTRHLAWADVMQVNYRPEKGEIRLYRTKGLAPFVLRLPEEEYAQAEDLVRRFCKGK